MYSLTELAYHYQKIALERLALIMKRVLVVLTNISTYGSTDDATGLWLGEATEFVAELKKVNIDVDYMSPLGGYVPIDPRSLKYANQEIYAMYRNPEFLTKALKNSLAPTEVNPNDYIAIYYTGGHGVMWDFPDNLQIAKIAEEIYANNGYISSVCHGIAGLFPLSNQDGSAFLAQKKVTGFTTSEEYLSGKFREVPFLNEKIVHEQGGIFMKKRAYKPYAVQDGRLITGQNPFSPKLVAELLIKALA